MDLTATPAKPGIERVCECGACLHVSTEALAFGPVSVICRRCGAMWEFTLLASRLVRGGYLK